MRRRAPLPSYLTRLTDEDKALIAAVLAAEERQQQERVEAGERETGVSWARQYDGRPLDFIGEVVGPEWWSDDWRAWRALTKAVFAIQMDDAELEAYRECTGRSAPPPRRQREVWVPVGRRGGKSRWMAMMAVYLACCEDVEPYLAAGERGFISVLASDQNQAHQIMRYVKGMLADHRLVPMVERSVVKTVDLVGRVTIEIGTASISAVRSRTVVAALADEIAFWEADEESANPDSDVIESLTPAMITIPRAILIAASSPYARRGVLWDKFRRWYGQDGGPLVWKAPTVYMHPSVDRTEIDQKYEDDPQAAAAEFGAEFRTDVAAFVTHEVYDAVVARGRRSLPPVRGIQYRAFVDPSGGLSDSMTLAVAHAEPGGRGVLDLLVEVRPPFSTDETVRAFCEDHLRPYGVTEVQGDHYGGEFVREPFRNRGVAYELALKPKSDVYQAWLPLLTSRRVELLDHPRLAAQACSLERRTSRGGRDSIDHPVGAHDDLVNAAAGALVLACGDRYPALWTEDDVRVVA